MSRTIIRYDPEDIDFKDPIHSFLMGVILISALGFVKKSGEDTDFLMKRLIANILNQATDSGISISKSEIPAAFLRASAPPA